MQTRIFLLSAAALFLATSAASAATSELQRYADQAEAKADALLRGTGLDFKTRPVSVRASVDPDGRLNRLRVVRSSGSREVDYAVAQVLRKVVETHPLTGLSDGAVTLNVGGGAIVQGENLLEPGGDKRDPNRATARATGS